MPAHAGIQRCHRPWSSRLDSRPGFASGYAGQAFRGNDASRRRPNRNSRNLELGTWNLELGTWD